MAIIKAKETIVTIGVKSSTKERFNTLVKKFNEENRTIHGDKALKITCDDALNELMTKYPNQGE